MKNRLILLHILSFSKTPEKIVKKCLLLLLKL
jgi:hypothetical protein